MRRRGSAAASLSRRLRRPAVRKGGNDTIAEFARQKIRSIVNDPSTAELLCPQNVFSCKRLCVDTDYFETYNLPHVKLVELQDADRAFYQRRHCG